jgi:hypothetical protein
MSTLPVLFVHRRLGSIDFESKMKIMLAPAMKGTGYGLLTGGGLTVFIHILSYYTNYSAIIATYDSDYSGETLDDNNKGRYGLAMLLTGSFIIMSGIRQASKVNETEELKIALEDAKWSFESE